MRRLAWTGKVKTFRSSVLPKLLLAGVCGMQLTDDDAMRFLGDLMLLAKGE